MSSRRLTRAVAVAAALALSIGLAGCQTGPSPAAAGPPEQIELPPLATLAALDDPRAFEGPTTAVIGGPSLQPIAENSVSKLPATVLSHDRGGDREVEVTDTDRVLALSMTGTLADFVYAYGFGDRLIARDTATSVPGTEDLPVVTKSGHTLDAESVLALSPSLIITDGSIGPIDVLLQLRSAGVAVVVVTKPLDFASSYQSAREVAAALGVPQLGDELVAEIETAVASKIAEIEALAPANPADRPRVAFLYIRGTAGIYYLFGEGSGVDSLISAVGAVDVAEEIGWKGMRPMTDEALVAIDPDVIIVMTKGLESTGGVDGLLAGVPSVALTKAGKHRRIIDVDDTALFAGGTRLPDVLDGLARALYAPGSLPAGS
jgi:iron complex transport system substrate-binding protein